MPPENIARATNTRRVKQRQLPPLELEKFNTVAKALTAHMEAKSPIRT